MFDAKSHSVKILQSCFFNPFSLQSKQLQPDYVSIYLSVLIFLLFETWTFLSDAILSEQV
jgi:hypothetical protein